VGVGNQGGALWWPLAPRTGSGGHYRSGDAARDQHLVSGHQSASHEQPKTTSGPRVSTPLVEIVRLYGLRAWVEQSYKQVKTTLGWAQYQVRSSRAIQRHWILVYCAFTFCWWQAAQQSGADAWAGDPARQPSASAHSHRAASTKKVPPRPQRNPSYRGPPRFGRCAAGWSRPSCSSAISGPSRRCPRRSCFKIYLTGCGAARDRYLFYGLTAVNKLLLVRK
jgi:hypothetical protein